MREYECDKPFLPGANFTWLYFGSAATATATATAPTLTTTNTAIKRFLKRFLMIDCLQHKDVCLLAWVTVTAYTTIDMLWKHQTALGGDPLAREARRGCFFLSFSRLLSPSHRHVMCVHGVPPSRDAGFCSSPLNMISFILFSWTFQPQCSFLK